ncbi:MAG: conjugal transfer protein TrbI [Hyphomonas sp.]|uniref:TrbI F-type domain-containing protein n=1 Tax=Hyphomonas sp. TaxID=87 RepID=UPI001E09A740|nr:TrbI F-type domain-containing protein [Hyphomonas sp.]MBA4228960.1 conjugal transfer protein TrbI [Hyphomonas sp.]
MTDLFEHASAAPAEPTTIKSARRKPTSRFAGFSLREIILFAAAASVFVWGAWVTKTIAFDAPGRQEFVQLQLQGIIGEYLQAQARSNTDEQTAARETAVFMAALDQTVSGLSKSGKVVLVHEAIIGGDVPDVTPSVKAAVYAKVPRPQPAQALAAPPQGQAARVEQEMQAFMSANVGGQGGGQ